MLNPINFITPPLLFLYVFKFCLEERLARPPAVPENFLSLLIFPAPYGATDTSPAGCSRPCGSQQTSSGSGCHLHRPVHLPEQNRDSSSLHLPAWVRLRPPDKNQMLRFWNMAKYKFGGRWRRDPRAKGSRPHCQLGTVELERSRRDPAKCACVCVWVCMCVCVFLLSLWMNLVKKSTGSVRDRHLQK